MAAEDLFASRFYSEDDLRPQDPPTLVPPSAILDEAQLLRLERLADDLHRSHQLLLSPAEIDVDYIRLFLEMLRALGVISTEAEGQNLRVAITGDCAANFCKTLILYLKHRFCLINNWHTTRPISNHLTGLQFLLFAERRRVEQSVAAGFNPEIYNERPVAFAVIKAESRKHRCDVYLFECNKDWGRLNLVGGKMEPSDAGDYRQTMVREIEEELGVNRDSVRLTAFNEQPVASFGLTGGFGALSRYPARLFQAHFASPLVHLRDRFRWLTLDEFRRGKADDGTEFMVSPAYTDFLFNFNRLEGGLQSLPRSFRDPVDDRPGRVSRALTFLRGKKGDYHSHIGDSRRRGNRATHHFGLDAIDALRTRRTSKHHRSESTLWRHADICRARRRH